MRRYWAHSVGPSPLRGGSPKLAGYARKADLLLRVAATQNCFLSVFVVDADGCPERPLANGVRYPLTAGRNRYPQRFAELIEWRASLRDPSTVAIGVAVQMVEAWLLADPELRDVPLPAGQTPESLWGQKRDPASNYPKHVVRRCLLDPRSRSYREVVADWEPGRAGPNASWLAVFIAELRALCARAFDGG